MRTRSKSTLRIFLKKNKQEKPGLTWQLSGYHGEDWSVAQVFWSGADATQVGQGYVRKQCIIAHSLTHSPAKPRCEFTDYCGQQPQTQRCLNG